MSDMFKRNKYEMIETSNRTPENNISSDIIKMAAGKKMISSQTQRIDRVNPDIIGKLKNLTYQTYCKNFSSKYEDMIQSGDMKGTFKVLQDFVKLAIKHEYKIPQQYKPSKDSPDGRLFVIGPGIQKLPKKVRGILVDGIYTDYDMINAHPKILGYICRGKGIACDKLSEYVNCRDKKFADFMETDGIPRDEAKKMFLTAINKEAKTTSFKKGKRDIKIKNQFFKEFDEELKDIQIQLMKSNPDIGRKLRAQGQTVNLQGKVVNRLMCSVENQILSDVSKEFNTEVLMFDGFMAVPQYSDDEAIRRLNSISFKYDVKWDTKPHDTSCKEMTMALEDNGRLFKFADNTNEMARDLLEGDLKDKFIFWDGDYYFKTDKCWVHGKDVKRCLYQYACKHDFIVGEDVNISEKFALCNELRDILLNLNTNSLDVDELVRNDTKTKICFKNGYYDFADKQFQTDNDVNTFFRIDRDFNTAPNEKVIQEIYDKILNPTFTTSIEGRDTLRDTWLYQVAARMAGTGGKEWSVVMGSRDCGKGVLGDLLGSALGPYIGVSNIENFKMKQNVSDVARSFSWLSKKAFNKLIIFNETEENEKGSTISGNMIKKITGGDALEVRGLYQDEKLIKLMGSILVFCNDFPEIKPADANDTRINYNLISKFIDAGSVHEDKSIQYFDRDNTIKSWVCQPEVCDAFIHILIDIYTKGRPVLSDQFKSEIRHESLTESTTTLYNRYFVVDEDNFVKNQDLWDFNTKIPENLGTKAKIVSELKRRFGCSNHRVAQGRGLRGIRLLIDE